MPCIVKIDIFIRFNILIDFNLIFILLQNKKSIFNVYLLILYSKNLNGIFFELRYIFGRSWKIFGRSWKIPWMKKRKINLKGKKGKQKSRHKTFVPRTTQTHLQGRWNSYKKERFIEIRSGCCHCHRSRAWGKSDARPSTKDKIKYNIWQE